MSMQHGQPIGGGPNERQPPNVLNVNRHDDNQNNAQARPDLPQHVQDTVDALPPWFQAQLNLETGKCAELRERCADEKKARVKVEKKLTKSESKRAVEKERHAVKERELTKENTALAKENSKLKVQVSKVNAQKTQLEHANRAMKAGENAAAMAKKLRPTGTHRGRNNPNKVVKWERTFNDVVMDFRSWMGGKKVNQKGRCPMMQVRAKVEDFLQHGRFADERKKKNLETALIDVGRLIADDRTRKAVKAMVKHL